MMISMFIGVFGMNSKIEFQTTFKDVDFLHVNGDFVTQRQLLYSIDRYRD